MSGPSKPALSNAVLGLWLAWDGVRFSGLASGLSPTVDGILFGVAMLVCAGFVVVRPTPVRSEKGPGIWLLVIVATLVPLTYTLLPCSPYPAAVSSSWIRAAQWAGAAGVLTSVLYLRRSFSLLPQARGVVCRGPYRLVRHPMYASYLLLDMTYWCVGCASIWPVLVWSMEAAFLFWRARVEERVLVATFEEYRTYCRRVRHMFLPGLV
jgi:protein-S-isoprenylcysteine O-methyltransferase Ste14